MSGSGVAGIGKLVRRNPGRANNQLTLNLFRLSPKLDQFGINDQSGVAL